MALVKKYYTDLNETRWGLTRCEHYYGSNQVKQEYYNGKLIYNNALYELEITDPVQLDPPGGNDALNAIHGAISSRKTDVDGTINYEVPYKIYPEDLSIPPNETDEPVYGEFTVVQDLTGLRLIGSYEQAPNELQGVSFSDLEILNVYYDYNSVEEMVPAKGGTASLVVEYRAKKTYRYPTGSVDGGYEYGVTTSPVVIIGGKYDYSHVTFSNDGKVYAESLYDSLQQYDFKIAYVQKLQITVTFTSDEIETSSTTLTKEWTSSSTSTDVICYQQHNTIEKETEINKFFSITDAVADAAPTAVVLTATSYRTVKYEYTSKYSTPEKEEAVGGSVHSYSSGITSVSPNNWTNKTQLIQVDVSGNYNTKQVTHILTISNGTSTVTATIVQDGDYITGTIKKNIRSANELYSEEISAVGTSKNAVQIYVVVAYDLYQVWASTDESFLRTESLGVAASSISGNTVSGTGGTKLGTTVYADSRGTQPDDYSRPVYNITYAYCTYENKTITFDGSYYVMQEPNMYQDSDPVYYLTCDTNYINVDARGGSETVTVYSYVQVLRTYSSTAQEYTDTSVSTSITSSNTSVATVSPSSVTGKNKTFTVTVKPNTSTSYYKYATITLTQSNSSKQLTIEINQEKDYLIEQCGNYIAQSVSAEEIPARGGSSQVVVTYSKTCGTYSYATGNQIGSSTTTTQTVNATKLTTNISTNIGTASGGIVSVGSRGQVTGPVREVYKVTGGSTSLGSFAITGYVYQQENEYIDEITSDSLTISKTSPSGNIPNTGGNATFAVSATYTGTVYYTSGSYTTTGNNTASISASPTTYKSLSPTTITGSGNVILTLNPSYSNDVKYTVTAKTNYSSKSASVTQTGASIVLDLNQDTYEVDPEATTIDIVYTSTLNGSVNVPNSGNISSNQSWAKIGSTTYYGTECTTTVSISANTNTTSRTATITITATGGSGLSITKTVNIIQNGASVTKPSKLVKFNGTFYLSGTTLQIQPGESGYTKATFSAKEDSDYIYTGGTFNYYFVVSSNTSTSGKIKQTSTYSITVNKGSSKEISLSNITGLSSSAMFVLLYVDNKLFETYPIDQAGDEMPE